MVAKSNSNNSAFNVNKSDDKKAVVENRQNKVSGFFDPQKLLTRQVFAGTVTGTALGLVGGGVVYLIGAKEKREMNSTITSLRNDLDSKNKTIQAKDSEISSLKSDIQELKDVGGADTQALKDDIKNLKNQISQKEQKIEELDATTKAKDTQIQNINKNLKEKTEKLNAAEKALLGGDEEKKKLLAEVQNRKNELEKKISELENILETKDAEIKKITSEKEKMKTVEEYKKLKEKFKKLLEGKTEIKIDEDKKNILFLFNGSQIGKVEYLFYDNDPNYPKNSLYIESITVDEEYRGLEIAGLLMNKAIEIAKAKGKKTIFLETEGTNESMQKAANKIGFDRDYSYGGWPIIRMKLSVNL